MALIESEKALILALLDRIRGLGDPPYGRNLAEIASEALGKISSAGEPVRIIHVDVGGRTLETPGTPASIIKLAVYTLELKPQPGGELWYHTYQINRPEGPQRLHLLYARGDYRVRQALTYIVELAALLRWLREESKRGRGLIVGIKDGPLVQQLAQYLSPNFDLPEETARSALYYAGLDNRVVEDLIYRARRRKRRDSISSGALMALILDELYETAENGDAYPAGVVEDTSRSSTLLFKLVAEAIIDLVLEAARSPYFNGEHAVHVASAEATKLLGVPLGINAERFARCLCESEEEIRSLGRRMADIMNPLLEAINRAVTLEGSLPGLAAIVSKVGGAEDGRLESVRAIVRALARGQLLPLSTRDPDIIMAAYYLGFLDSHATKEFERHELYASALDAIEARAVSEDNALQMEDVKETILRVISRLKARYLVVDPPLRCDDIGDRLYRAGVSALEPCLIAASDTYTYAPPIRLEYYRDPGSPISLVELAFLEAFLTRYKYPQGVMVADIASRVRYEEALTARPLAERLIPLRYYVRSWEKRIELM